ncbi:MAG: sensor histidine kinase [Solirubrobacteraceae bacterium]
MRLRLRARFALLAAALVLLVSSLVGLVGYLTLRHSLLSRTSVAAQTEAARLVGLIGSSSDVQGDSLDITDRALTRQLSTPGLRVEVDRPGGARVQSTPAGSRTAPALVLPALTRTRCLTAGRAQTRIASPPAQVACERVGSARAPLGTVSVAAPLRDALTSLDTLASALLLAVLGGSAIAAALALVLARRALRPVKRIAAAAETIRCGELNQRIDYRGRDELGELARVLDACFDELAEGIERQRRFGADASHELKTPLAAIRANVELLRGWGALDPAARQAALASIDQASHRASRLVADLLQLVKLDREPERARAHVTLDEVVLSAVREATPLRCDVAIRVVRLDEATIDGDPLGLEQLLLNLLDNALAASPAGAEVEIALAAADQRATITVIDGGPGIPIQDLNRIFDRFYSRKIGSEPRASAGLGLAIARAIAEDHGGELIAGNRPNGGAVFTLTLPLAIAEEPGRSTRALAPSNALRELSRS